MKKVFSLLIVITFFAGALMQAHAELYNRGTDTLGNSLIYDSDLDITWYDYTNSPDSWDNQMSWAESLTVDFGGTVYKDWGLPSVVLPGGWGPMPHLYNITLGNEWGGPLSNTGPFQNLMPTKYFTGLYIPGNIAMAPLVEFIDFSTGIWGEYYWTYEPDLNGFAVHNGDISVVPEPISTMLFFIGGILLAGRRYIKRKK